MNYSYSPGIISGMKDAAPPERRGVQPERTIRMRFRQWITGIMAGRNGTDQLCRFLSIVTMVFLLLSLLIRGTGLSSVFWVLGLLCFFWGIFRSFSRNLARRQAENQTYLRLTRNIRGRFEGALGRFRQRKEYRFYRCPSCRTWLRVPRHKGKVQITCRQCGERFTRNT